MKPAISFLFIILSLLACRKEVKGPTIVYGKVLEQGTNKPVPNALVKLVNANGNFHPRFEVIHDSTRTDSNGYYEIEIDKAFYESIMVYAKGTNYLNHQDHTDYVSSPETNVRIGSSNNVTISLRPYCFLGFSRIKDSSKYEVRVNEVQDLGGNSTQSFFLSNEPYFARTEGNSRLTIHFYKMFDLSTYAGQQDSLTITTHSTDTIWLKLGF